MLLLDVEFRRVKRKRESSHRQSLRDFSFFLGRWKRGIFKMGDLWCGLFVIPFGF